MSEGYKGRGLRGPTEDNARIGRQRAPANTLAALRCVDLTVSVSVAMKR
jgi:hypothetical protein